MEFETENSSRHQEGWMEALLYSKLEQFILKKGSARQTVNNSNVYTVLRVRLVLTFIPELSLYLILEEKAILDYAKLQRTVGQGRC